MTEIRPIRAHEAESFLRLLCDVFGLDFGRAHRIFFTEPMFDLNRKWALFESGQIVSILTTVGLEFGWGRAIGIAGVATRHDMRGKGLATHLLEAVLGRAQGDGEGPALLFAKEPKIYERLGFAVCDEVVRAPIVCVPEREPFDLVEFAQVQEIYNRWALQDPNRLRRDDRRWGFWRWNLRICSGLGGGYICTEAGIVREAILGEPVRDWPLAAGTEWLGLSSMAQRLEIPLRNPVHELHLMTRQTPANPQLFMTDQF